MDKPTQEDFDKCRDVLEYIAKYTKQHEPFAISTIEAAEKAISECGF